MTLNITKLFPIESYHAVEWNDRVIRGKVVDSRIIADKTEYYIHFSNLDRRLDDWVPSHLVLSHDLPPSHEPEPVNPSDEEEINAEIQLEQERQEITKVRTINQIRLGDYLIRVWYFSPYPDEFKNASILYICPHTFKYMLTLDEFQIQRAIPFSPPGALIYEKDSISIFEVDGKIDKLFCQNLCLLSKLFLDHKTLFFDIQHFNFYILTQKTAGKQGFEIVGYFSKEKKSLDDYNLACILILPPFQRRGYGRTLVEFSSLRLTKVMSYQSCKGKWDCPKDH